MCGLIAQIKKKDDGVPTQDTVKGMLTSQIHRGTQGFGYIAFNDTVQAYVRREYRYEIEKIIDKNTMRSIIFHHRIPTSTPNLADCTHPIKVSHTELKYDYYLIHNGMISNDSVLHKEYTEIGYEYNTTVENSVKTKNSCNSKIQWNDSESLAIDVARVIEKKQDKIQSRGSIAFICAQTEKETGKVLKIFFGRNSSPLTIKQTTNSIILRSEGEKDSIDPNTMYCLDMQTFKIKKEHCQIGEIVSVRNDPSQGYNTGGYFHSDFPIPRHNIDWDDEDRAPVGMPIYRGGTMTHNHAPSVKVNHDFETELCDEQIADQWVHQEVNKINAILEELEEKLLVLIEDVQIFKEREGFEVEIEQTEKEIEKIEDDIEKFEIDKELLLSGEFSETER